MLARVLAAEASGETAALVRSTLALTQLDTPGASGNVLPSAARARFNARLLPGAPLTGACRWHTPPPSSLCSHLEFKLLLILITQTPDPKPLAVSVSECINKWCTLQLLS